MSEKGGKKGEEGQLWRAVSCKQAAGQYTCLSPVHDHSTAYPHFLVNSCFSPQRELCECSSYFVCACEMLANSSQTSWQVVCLAGLGAGYWRDQVSPAWSRSGNLYHLHDYCLCVSGEPTSSALLPIFICWWSTMSTCICVLGKYTQPYQWLNLEQGTTAGSDLPGVLRFTGFSFF